MVKPRDFRDVVKEIEHDNKRKDILKIFSEKKTRSVLNEKNTL